MNPGPHQIYWRDILVGTVTEVGWTDFPWVGGKITLFAQDSPLREALEYIGTAAHSPNGLQDWPFPDDVAEHWTLHQPDGEIAEISLPVIDFTTGFVEWR